MQERRSAGAQEGHCCSCRSRPKLKKCVQPRHTQSKNRRLAIIDAIGEADGGGCVITAECAHDERNTIACSRGCG